METESSDYSSDTITTVDISEDTVASIIDTMLSHEDDTTTTDTATNIIVSLEENEPQRITQGKHTKGYAMVHCPIKMIKHVPSIINAAISNDEISVAYQRFAKNIQKQDPAIDRENIIQQIRGDSIDLYNKMKVTLEFDDEVFKLVSTDNSHVKEFNGKKIMEWDWIVKPIQSARRSIIKVKFYGINPENNEEHNILEKTINITVTVDSRSFIDKWLDFLLEDTKTTMTAIVIPFVTFLGGFLVRKKS